MFRAWVNFIMDLTSEFYPAVVAERSKALCNITQLKSATVAEQSKSSSFKFKLKESLNSDQKVMNGVFHMGIQCHLYETEQDLKSVI